MAHLKDFYQFTKPFHEFELLELPKITAQEFHGVVDHFIDKKKAYRQTKFNTKLDRPGGLILPTLWTVNDVTGKDPLERPRGVFTGSAGAFHLERPLKFQFTAFEGSFQVKCPHSSSRTTKIRLI